MITGASAIALGAALGIVPAIPGPHRDGLFLLGGTGVALLILGLAMGRAVTLPWAFGVLAGEYVVSLYTRDAAFDPLAAAYGAALLLTAELAYWSLEFRTPTRDDDGLKANRLLAIVTVVTASLCVGLIAAVAALAPVNGGLILTIAGTGAAVAAFVWLAVTARRISP